MHLQAIQFQIAKLIVDQLVQANQGESSARQRVLRLQSRHRLFPQVYRFVDEYVRRKVDFQGSHPCEPGLEKYVARMVERLRDAIEPDDSQGEPPLMPVLNRYKPIGTTADVDFKTTRPCFATHFSHINMVVTDTDRWESSAEFYIEQKCMQGAVKLFSRNDHLGLLIPYEYMGIDHTYEPDYLVRLANDMTVLLEIKGYENDQTKAKHTGANRWLTAVNNWGQLGKWYPQVHVCRNPQMVGEELAELAGQT